MGTQAVSWKKVFMIAGAFCALWIGSGVTTGQEALQFASSSGFYKGMGTNILYTIFLGYIVYVLYGVGQREQFENPYDAFEYYCGKYIGNIYVWFTLILNYGIYVVMVAGSGAALHQYYGIPTEIGSYCVALVVLGTVVLGVQKLLDIIGVIGPLKVVFLLILGIAAVGSIAGGNTDVLAVNSELIQQAGFETASGNWLWSSVLWALLGLISGITFFVINAQTCQSVKEARLASLIGVGLVFIVNSLIITAEVVFLDNIRGQQIPTLAIAKQVIPFLTMFFAPLLVVCIYAAGSSILLVCTRKFSVDKTRKFNLVALGLTIFGTIAGTMLPFSKLVNILYPLSGYAGIALMGFILYKELINKNAFPFRKASDSDSVSRTTE